MKKCTFCAEDINDEAIKCKHCKSELRMEGDDIEKTQCIKCKKTINNDINVCPYCETNIQNYIAIRIFIACSVIGVLFLLLTTQNYDSAVYNVISILKNLYHSVMPFEVVIIKTDPY